MTDLSLLLTFYGDDFTGSTDSMETLEWGGVPTILFFQPPTPELIRERFPHIRALGVASVSRTLSPVQMDETLPPAFEALKALGASFLHYKVCSTFDSSPSIGNIGRATEIGKRIFDADFVPLLVGAPFLRRYVVFSNLFARVDDTTYRLDRHPTMSKHPITPMNEADLRLHLAKQTSLRTGAVNVLHLARPEDEVWEYLHTLRDAADIVVFDTLDDDHLLMVGRLLARLAQASPRFVVGSSGVEKALALHWQAWGDIQTPPQPQSPGEVEQLIVVSGSAAPMTAEQIDWALANGFAGMQLNAPRLIDPAVADMEREAIIQQALVQLGEGRSVVLYSARGPADPMIAQTKDRLGALKLDPQSVGSRLGTQQGLILRALLERTGLRRAVVTGGDTCGYAAQQLGIYALEAVMPIAPGAPLCRAYAYDPQLDGLLIALKAGQVGKPDFFGSILRGFA